MPPVTGWVRVNSDGATHGSPWLATAVGVIRNEVGEWLGGFAANLGATTTHVAELWRVIHALELAWDKGFRRVEVGMDSMLVLGYIEKGVDRMHPLFSLILRCQGFRTRDWIVRFNHIYHEGNRVADSLANVGFSLSLGVHVFVDPPWEVRNLLLDDLRGVSFTRITRV